MNENEDKLVTLRPMGNKTLSREPEMQELKRMVREGEIDRERTIGCLKGSEGVGGPEPVYGTHGTPAD